MSQQITEKDSYLVKYLKSLECDRWYQIRDVPDVIGYAGIYGAIADQVLSEQGYRLELGKNFSVTFRKVKIKKEKNRLIQKVKIGA